MFRPTALLTLAAATMSALPIPNCVPTDLACIHKIIGYERPSAMELYRAAKGER